MIQSGIAEENKKQSVNSKITVCLQKYIRHNEDKLITLLSFKVIFEMGGSKNPYSPK